MWQKEKGEGAEAERAEKKRGGPKAKERVKQEERGGGEEEGEEELDSQARLGAGTK